MPHGDEPEGVVDLGIRMRDQLLRGEVLAGGVRQVLADRLGAVAQSGRLPLSPGLVESVLHTWPLAAMIDDAVDTWREGPDPSALSVIARGMNVVSSALGWPVTVDRVWPMPDPEWIKREVGEGPFVVHPRGRSDGAPAVASVLDAPLGDPWPFELPPVIIGQGDELVSHVDEWLAAIDAGDAVAVKFETPVPWDRETRDALQRLRDATPAQLALARYGQAGLVCPDVPEFEDLLGRAPRTTLTEFPKAACDALILPHIDEQGRTGLAGALCWDGPFSPVLVHPFAIEVLQRLDGSRQLEDLTEELQATPEVLKSIGEQLADIGAVQG